ncbi:MAG: hypothetical protein Q8Q42_02790 [Nanoarchaeota archaeon]|nr:hypothetical protein [Nanoarchaeota archaeon]
MSNKKGLEYIDWIISMSFFIVTVMMIFAFLRPGIQPNFESKDLLNIVESNFVEESTWSSISIPVAIHNLNYDSNGNPASIKVKHEPTSDWQFINFYSKQDLNLLNIIITHDFDSFEITCSAFPCGTTTTSPSSQGIYLISLEKPSVSAESFEIADECSIDENPSPCDYLIGSKETVVGLDKERIAALMSGIMPYSVIKDNWDFPATREFEVSIDYLNGTHENLISPNIQIPLQSNVFVREILLPIIEKDGSRTPTKISIKVW